MCSDHPTPPASSHASDDDGPPDWENMLLPPAHILSHLTDAHCHPTDLDLAPRDYDGVLLGGMAAMATVMGDQGRVERLASERGWRRSGPSAGGEASRGGPGRGDGAGDVKEGQPARRGPKVVACFGYHPWFVHRYTLHPTPPPKEEHYLSIFFRPNSLPSSKPRQLLTALLPYLPDPIPFDGLLAKLRKDIASSLGSGRLTMLGEVGLDGGARVRWPVEARRLYVEKYPEREAGGAQPGQREELGSGAADDGGNVGGQEEHNGTRSKTLDAANDNHDPEWKRLTPFKCSMAHQRVILEKQLEVAIALGVNVSLHSVAAAGPTMDVLCAMRDRHRTRFTNRINVDLHSAGGWAPEFWAQAEKSLLNLYASPSIQITSRSHSAADLIRAISPDRLLVESDSHDARLTTRLVWGAVEWIGRCKGWRVEGLPSRTGGGAGSGEQGGRREDEQHAPDEHQYCEWVLRDEPETVGKHGEVLEGEREVVRTLERNWARFMHLID